MGVEQVSNTKPAVKTNGVTVSGENGAKLSKPEEQLAKLLSNVDGKTGLSKADIDKLKKMPIAKQIEYVNNKLKASGSHYRIANVYDTESGDTTKGINHTKNGAFFNISVGGKTITKNKKKGTGHLSVRW